MKPRTRFIHRNSGLKRTRETAALSATCSRISPTPQTRILVPIDFSDCSRAALQYAVSLAHPLKASLVLLYVAETNPAGSELGPCHLPQLEADLRHIAQPQLAQIRKQEIPADIVSQSVIRAGRADSEILDVA